MADDNRGVTHTERDAQLRALRAQREDLQIQLYEVDEALAALMKTQPVAPVDVAPAGGVEVVDPVAPTVEVDAAHEPVAVTAAEAPFDSSSESERAEAVVTTVVKSARVLSDAHRRALSEGRRRSLHAKEAAAGRAREALSPGRGLTSASVDADQPRLVKRRPTETRRG